MKNFERCLLRKKVTVLARVLVSLAAAFAASADGHCPVRELPSTLGRPPMSTDGGFYLTVSGNPEHYEPGALYTVSLRGDRTQVMEKRFSEFVLVAENAEAVLGAKVDTAREGSYQLLGDVLTRFSDHCTNTVTHTDSAVEKSEVQVLWTAPPPGSGCVTFKATVAESPSVWAMDSGRLSIRLCERRVAEHSSASPDEINEPCCACEEAKYEVIFEGLWSKERHPRDFPASKWLLHFSDIIGASHSAEYRVWKYDGYASKGLAQVAKWGSPRVLESELKSESAHIRTIIKTRGLWHPNENGKTFAVFRTDKRNHLVSLVSMLGPSPDWIVGVSGLELCQRNCSWAEEREVFLYPWDAGVDGGISYESADQPTFPPQPITRISSTHPNDPRQPFYNASGAPMRPLAKLTITRERLYRKSCGDGDDGGGGVDMDDFVFPDGVSHETSASEDDDVPECAATAWSAWSPCGVTCGKGISMRTRDFADEEEAAGVGCDRQMIQKEMCSADGGAVCHDNRFYSSAPADFLPDDMCSTTEWSRWSECSTTCGKGFRTQTRRFFNRMGRKKCPHVDTMNKTLCAGALSPVCPFPNAAAEAAGRGAVSDPHCAVTDWSDWSPCSVSCGRGLKVRTRLYMVSPQQQTSAECSEQLMEKSECEGARPDCEFSVEDARLICGMKKEVGPCRGYFPRHYFDADAGSCRDFVYGGCRGNSNNFVGYDDCARVCGRHSVSASPPEKVMIGFHNGSETFDFVRVDEDGAMMRKRKMMMAADERRDAEEAEADMARKRAVMGAAAHSHSPSLLSKAMTAKQRMMDKRLMMKFDGMTAARIEAEEEAVEMRLRREFGPPVDCLVTSWSPWSACSASCGRAFKRKFRMIKRYPSPSGGKKCPRKMEKKKKCRIPLCPPVCAFGEWGDWSPCSQSCGADGAQERTRTVEWSDGGDGGGGGEEHECGARTEKRFCFLSNCP